MYVMRVTRCMTVDASGVAEIAVAEEPRSAEWVGAGALTRGAGDSSDRLTRLCNAVVVVHA